MPLLVEGTAAVGAGCNGAVCSNSSPEVQAASVNVNAVTTNTTSRPVRRLTGINFFLNILRNYARLVIEQDRELTWAEEEEKEEHLREYLSLGSSLKWSEKDMVTLLLKEAICP